MDWKIVQLKQQGDNYIARYKCGKITGDVGIVLPDGAVYDDLTESDIIGYVKTSINTMADGSIRATNVQNIEQTAQSSVQQGNEGLPWEGNS